LSCRATRLTFCAYLEPLEHVNICLSPLKLGHHVATFERSERWPSFRGLRQALYLPSPPPLNFTASARGFTYRKAGARSVRYRTLVHFNISLATALAALDPQALALADQIVKCMDLLTRRTEAIPCQDAWDSVSRLHKKESLVSGFLKRVFGRRTFPCP
jgi:hypothetical protein